MKTAMLLLIVLVGALALNELEIKKKWAEFKTIYKMKTAISLLLVFVVGALALTDKEVGQQWARFKVENRKSYRSAVDDMERLNIFKQNLQKIEAHNKLYGNGEVSYKKGVTQFADMTETEFMEYLNKSAASRPRESSSDLKFEPSPTADVPDSIDWTQKAAVTPVADQGLCGSCWAFSAVGALEALNGLRNGDLTPLSEQNLVDCSRGIYGNNGCDGGLMNAAFDYVKYNGIEKASDYPYKARDGLCKFIKSRSVLKISGYVYMPPGDEDALKVAVGTIQPISVAIDASKELQLYKSGVLDDLICENTDEALNHGVLAVGYGTEKGQEYWLIKNSWGETWGEEGYFKLIRNSGNRCGVATSAIYPLA